MRGILFCDESGFDGGNLLNDEQPFFVYASVAISHEQVEEVVAQVKSDANVQGELKFGKLFGRHRGPKTITRLLTEHAPHTRVIAFNKKYAAAGKFFEYVFEPVLRDEWNLFYGIGFHRFISNLLYFDSGAKDNFAKDLLIDAQKLIRNRDATGLKQLLSPPGDELPPDHPIAAIAAFAFGYGSVILEEIDVLRKDATAGKWAMDLTDTALLALLRYWGQHYDELDVYCDESKPLKASIEYVSRLATADTRQLDEILGRTPSSPVRYLPSIELHASKRLPGLQIADVIAGAARMVATDLTQGESPVWYDILAPCFDGDCVLPDHHKLNLDQEEAWVNSMVLLELAERAEKGADPLIGMPELVAAFRQAFWEDRRQSR